MFIQFKFKSKYIGKLQKKRYGRMGRNYQINERELDKRVVINWEIENMKLDSSWVKESTHGIMVFNVMSHMGTFPKF